MDLGMFSLAPIEDLELSMVALAGGGCVLAAGLAWTSYVFALRLTGDAPTSVRWCAAAVIGYWLQVSLFYALAAVNAFRLPVALLLCGALTALSHWAVGRTQHAASRLREDLAHLGTLLRGLWQGPGYWALALAGLMVAIRATRALAAPPLTWDALTYHLLKAGRWVQSGGFAPEVAPDAWGYYEYFSPVGDIPFAWAMLAFHGDSFLALSGLAVWLTCALGTYAAARSLGAGGEYASLAALALGLVPAVVQHLTSYYVDTMLLACFVLAVPLLARSGRSGRGGDALLAAAALGICAGTKLTGLPILLLGAVTLVYLRRRVGAPWRADLLLGAGCLAAVSVALLPYLRGWVEQGSPLYPLPVTLGGRLLLPGNEALDWLLSAQRAEHDAPISYFLGELLGARHASRGLGPTAPAVVVLAAAGGVRIARAPAARAIAGFLVLAAAMNIASVAGDETVRGAWASTAGRYVTPAFAALVILGSAATGRWARWLWIATIVGEFLLSAPPGWSEVDFAASAALVVLTAPFLLAAWAALLTRASRRHPRWSRTLAGALVLCCAVPVAYVRDSYRDRFYAAAARRETWDATRLQYATAAPIWSFFDRGRTPHRLAVTAGWDTLGHNWYRYPLLGSKLQNRLFYVPVTGDGSVIDYRLETEVRERADLRAWLGRLLALRIDFVVALEPANTVEMEWMLANPRLFEPVAEGIGRRSVAFRLNRGALPSSRASSDSSWPPLRSTPPVNPR